MYEVTVNREVLLERIKANRENHRAEFEKALGEYEQAVILELEEWLERARKGERVARRTVLQQPQDHTGDYDQVIDMLEMSVDETITLDSGAFAHYVRDEWAWKGQFGDATASIAQYLGKRGS